MIGVTFAFCFFRVGLDIRLACFCCMKPFFYSTYYSADDFDCPVAFTFFHAFYCPVYLTINRADG